MGARILALEETIPSLRSGLVSSLRPGDEAIILPQAEICSETGHFKNVVYRLMGDAGQVPIRIFSPAWFSGISISKVSEKEAEEILSRPERRDEAARKLRDEIPSEMYDTGLQVGPRLDGDEFDKDAAEWTAGFDSGSSCVGLYCAECSRAPEVGKSGMNRMHREYFLVCKAGPGLAGSTFHTRLVAAIKKGRTLDEALETGMDPGAQALRRVSLAGSRNRARILLLAANALGLTMIDTLGDQASGSKYRGAVVQVDVCYNSLRKVEGCTRSTWQYSSCVDASVSTGLVASSNMADGFILFLSNTGEFKHQLRNDLYSTLPFASCRLKSVSDLAAEVLSKWKKSTEKGETAHVDSDWISSTFVWKSKEFSKEDPPVEPFALWGSHEAEAFIAKFSRELGIDRCNAVRLRPKLVCVASVDPGKLRPLVRSLRVSDVPVD